jgi:dTDP-4-amino-4,6-dideoxygalactose transaminase
VNDVVPFVDLKAQYDTIRDEVTTAVAAVFESSQFVLGDAVSRFERAFAEYLGSSHAVGVASGLDALSLALRALNVGPGDEVILPANTYIATALAVSAVGATPVLVDCREDTYQIDPALIEQAISSRTRALIPVHLYGQAADMAAIGAIAEAHGLPVVEDAAQAHGTQYDGRRCGTFGRMGCFSFYPGKNLGAYGDGGLVVTDDENLAERLRRLRNYGQRVKYEHVEKGVNSRLDSVQAAVLGVKLPYLDGWNARRAGHAARYSELLAGRVLAVPARDPRSTHTYHLYVVRVANREAIVKSLAERGIQTGIHYPIPIHLQSAYRDLGYGPGDFPVAERCAGEILSLPMYAELTEEQIEAVVGALGEAME